MNGIQFLALGCAVLAGVLFIVGWRIRRDAD